MGNEPRLVAWLKALRLRWLLGTCPVDGCRFARWLRVPIVIAPEANHHA